MDNIPCPLDYTITDILGLCLLLLGLSISPESQTIVLRPVPSRKPEWCFSLPTGPATTVRADGQSRGHVSEWQGQAERSLRSPGGGKGEEIVVSMNKVNLAFLVSTPERTQPSLESSVWVVAEVTEGGVPLHFC